MIPIQHPIKQLRNEVAQYLGSLAQVSNTTLARILALLPEKDKPSSIDCKISPIPKRPITAIKKSKPRMSSVDPKVIRNWPVTVSIPTAAKAKPNIMAEITLKGEPLFMPTKLQKVNR